jgi:hypothetical protein
VLAAFVLATVSVHDMELKKTRCVSCRCLDASCQRTSYKLKLMQKNVLMLRELVKRTVHLLTLSRVSWIISSILLPLVVVMTMHTDIRCYGCLKEMFV